MYKETIATLATFGALGAGIGYAVEQHTNDVSRGRVVTIDTCMKVIPHENTINKPLLKCMEDGVPNAKKIGDFLKEGQPIEFVDTLRTSQVNEAKTADTGNVVLYGLGGVAVAVFLT